MRIVLAIDLADERSRLELVLGFRHQIASVRSLQDAIPLVDRAATDAVVFDLVDGDFPAPAFVKACRNTSRSADTTPKFICLVEKQLVVGRLVDWLRQLAHDDGVDIMLKPIDHDALLLHLDRPADAESPSSSLQSTMLRLDHRHDALEKKMVHLDETIRDVKDKLALFQERLHRIEAKK